MIIISVIHLTRQCSKCDTRYVYVTKMRLPFIVALSKGSRVIKVVSYTQELQGKGTVHSKLKSTCLTSAVQCCLFLLMFGFPELEILVVEMFASLLNILQLNSTCFAMLNASKNTSEELSSNSFEKP